MILVKTLLDLMHESRDKLHDEWDHLRATTSHFETEMIIYQKMSEKAYDQLELCEDIIDAME